MRYAGIDVSTKALDVAVFDEEMRMLSTAPFPTAEELISSFSLKEERAVVAVDAREGLMLIPVAESPLSESYRSAPPAAVEAQPASG